MNNVEWVKNKIAAKVQTTFLVALQATLLGLMGWLVGGNRLALMLIAGVIMLYFLSPMISPAFLLNFNSGRQLSTAEAPRLYDILNKLSRRANLTRLPVLFYLPTNAMLAFTVGPRDKAAIAISKGLMRGLSLQELTAVLAHEISHIGHNDIRTMVFAGMVGQFTRLLSLFGQFMLLFSLPTILVGQVTISWFAIFLLIFSPTLTSLIELALSRSREYNADMSAAELTGNPEALASALARIDNFQRHLFNRINWPMIPRVPQSSWLRTHPPTKERIRRLLEVRDYDRSSHNYPFNMEGNYYQIT